MTGAHQPKPGDVLAGKYRVERLLGEGGMGIVFAARQLDLDRPVALKLLGGTALAHADARARFLREARAAAALDSEHAVRVLDTGTLDDGAPYIAMERLEGCDLGTAIKTLGALPPDVATLCVVQACRAIGEAHARGIIHRDIKPSNLFAARRFDGSERIVVLDFGISKAVAPDAAGLDLTATRETMGSPTYMSPEQVRSSKHVDARSDVWALGVVLYELLTGVPPFIAPSLTALSAMIVEEQPRAPRECRPAIPPELERIVLRCLEKKPAERFATVAELMSALVPFAAGAEVRVVSRVAAYALEAPPNSRADTLPASSLEPPRSNERDLVEASTRAPVARPLLTTETRRAGSRAALAALGFVLAAGAVGAVAMRVLPSASRSRSGDVSGAALLDAGATCVETGRHTLRRNAMPMHLTMASGLEHGLLTEWGIRADRVNGELESDILPLTLPMPPSPALTALRVPNLEDAKQVRVASGTLHDDVFVVAAVRAPHFRNPRAEITRWIGFTPDAKGAFSTPLGARVIAHATTDLAVASSVSAVTGVGIGDRVDVETAKFDGFEVRIGSLFGPPHERVILEGSSAAERPARVLATAARARPIAVLVGPTGISAVSIVEGDVASPVVSLVTEATGQAAAASRGDEAFVAWIDRPTLEARYRRLPDADGTRFEFEAPRTLAVGPVTSIALAARGRVLAVAWSESNERGRRVHVGVSRGSLDEAAARAITLDAEGEVRGVALAERGVWIVHGGASSLGLVTLHCGGL